jgi:sporulation protein YlmC with PRC-barrel domain
MKSPLLKATVALSLVFIAAAVPDSAAQPARDAAPPPSARMDLTRGVLIASIYAEDRSLRHYAGQTLWNSEGAGLGTVRDFIVHPASNRLRYAVVSSGGILGRFGNSLRLVPFEVVRHDQENDRLVVDILHSRWLQIPPVRDADYEADRFPMNATLHQELTQRFGSAPSATAAPDRPAAGNANEFEGLIRASELRGKTVRTSEFTVGRIENIIIDLDQGVAAALVDASRGLIGTTAKYLLPLERLTVENSRQDPLTTTLTRADFDRAQPSDYGLNPRSSAKIERAEDESPSPTGRASQVQAPQRAMTESARAVRQALDNNAALARENIQVLAENGRIVLQGSVHSEQVKEEIEAAARRAAPNGDVDSRITVQR